MRSNFFIVTGAEGSGKSVVIKELEKIIPFYLVQYVANSDLNEPGVKVLGWKDFQALAENDEFVLSYQKKNALIGVSHKELQNALASGKPVVWEVDLKHIDVINNDFPEATVILINGLAIEDLYERFESKGHAVPAAIALRAKVSNTMNKSFRESVDYIVENRKNESSKAAEEIKKIIENG